MALVLWLVLVTMATLVLALLFVCACLRTKRKGRGGAKEQTSSGMNEEPRDEEPPADGYVWTRFVFSSIVSLDLNLLKIIVSPGKCSFQKQIHSTATSSNYFSCACC